MFREMYKECNKFYVDVSIVTMAECAPVFNVMNSADRLRVGRPKKCKDSWSALNKRVYILGLHWKGLGELKKVKVFPVTMNQ